jgi:hypothetical protein
MKLKPELFFPTDKKGIIKPPYIFNSDEKSINDYIKLPTLYKAEMHQKTSEYLACIIGENYQILFRRNGEITLSCNFKPDKEVFLVQDLLDYGVVLQNGL